MAGSARCDILRVTRLMYGCVRLYLQYSGQCNFECVAWLCDMTVTAVCDMTVTASLRCAEVTHGHARGDTFVRVVVARADGESASADGHGHAVPTRRTAAQQVL